MPTEPGFILQPIYLHFSGDAGVSRTFPIAGRVTSDLDAEVNSVTLGALYTFDNRVLGGRYTVGIYAPYIWQEVTATFTTDRRTIRREDKVDGFGDITLLPVGLAWDKGNWQLGGRLPIHAPTGSYKVGRLSNPGLNYWTFDPTVSLSYGSEKSGLNAALFAGMTFNTKNEDTRYQSGSVLHVEANVQQLLPLWIGVHRVGSPGISVRAGHLRQRLGCGARRLQGTFFGDRPGNRLSTAFRFAGFNGSGIPLAP